MRFCIFLVKQFWADRGVKDGQHEKMKEVVLLELQTVERKDRITKIIHETYVKEIERLKKKAIDDEIKAKIDAELEEQRLILEAERLALKLKRQQQLLMNKKNIGTSNKKHLISTPASVKVRVVGGGGQTNTAKTKDEKRVGYSPSKVSPTKVIPFSFDDSSLIKGSPSKLEGSPSKKVRFGNLEEV